MAAVQVPLGADIAHTTDVRVVHRVLGSDPRLSAAGGAIGTRIIAHGIDVTQIRRLRVSFYLRVGARSHNKPRRSPDGVQSVSTVGVDVGLAGTILWCILRARSAEAHHNALIMRLIR